MKSISYFITGTDTEIGKTTLSCLIIRALGEKGLRVAPMKPVAAGAVQIGGTWKNEDVDALSGASNLALPVSLVCPFLLKTPAAPHLAAKLDGYPIDVDHILSCYRALCQLADAVIVEGVGGFCVPFTDRVDSSDLAVKLNLPVILVVGIKLGCINHALLTAEAIRARGLKLAGWIANRIDPDMMLADENIRTLEALLDAPRLGTVPYLESFAEAHTYLNLASLPDWPL